jgi:putative AbiEii toxin of type IV toxin-antitoxin system/AAA ATPase-like protein
VIDSFQIRNYRGFKDFGIDGLERVNLVTGSNNVGKTSFLEALYLNVSPNTALIANLDSDRFETSTRHNIFRGFRDVRFSLDNVAKWGWLFYGKNLTKDIELTSILNAGQKKIQMRWMLSHKSGDVPVTSDIPFDGFPGYLRVLIKDTDGTETVWKVDKNGHRAPETYVFDSTPLRLLFNNSSRPPDEDAKWFSKLADVGRQDEILDTLKLIEPRLKALAISTSDGPPMIYGDLGLGRRIPMSQMGEGMVRLLSLVLEITNAEDGIVLIDEIETGLHYSVMKNVWKAVATAAERANAQIFATTHSFECVRAAHEAFLAREKYDFGLHRLERIDDEIRAVTYEADVLSAAIVSDFEVR